MNPFTKAHIRLDRNLTILIATGMVCATMLLFAMFIWPTPYTYQKVADGYLFRINRLTGSAERVLLTPNPESPESQSSSLMVFFGLGVIGMTAVAILIRFRGTGALNYFFDKATITLATTLRDTRTNMANACIIQDNSRQKAVNHNENVKESEPRCVPQAVRQYGGIRRLAYWIGLIGILVINQVFIVVTQGNPIAALFGFAIIITLAFVLMVNRLRNIGMSEWWSLLILVPLGNLFLGVECGIYPEGYSDTKRLDLAGRILTWITFGCLVVVILAVCITLLELVYYEYLHL